MRDQPSARARFPARKPLSKRGRLEKLEREEAQLRSIFEGAAFGIVLSDANGQTHECNPALERMLGYTKDELRTMRISDLTHPDDTDETERALHALVEGELERVHTERRFIRKDGSLVWVHVIASTVSNSNGELALSIAMIEDISALKSAEADTDVANIARKSAEADTDVANIARESAEADTDVARDYAADLIETAGAMIVGLDLNGSIQLFNKAAEEITGYTREELAGRNWFEVVVPRERYPHVWAEFERLLAGGMPRRFENPILTKSGEERYIVWRNTDLQGKGRNAGAVSIGIDVTEHKRAEEALQRERDLVDRIMETSPAGIVALNRAGEITFANASAEEALGLGKDAATGRKYNAPSWRITDYDGEPYPEDELPFSRVMATGQAVRDVRHAIERPDGHRVLMSVNAAPIFDKDGGIDGVVAAIQDVTDLVRAEEERALLQAELLQAQKMEAVGRLAGGVAHNFNNLLTAISGYNELLLAKLPADSDLRAEPEEVKRAADRAAKVARELLVFSRRETGQRESLNLSDVVSGMEVMLRQLIRADTEIVTDLATGLDRVEGDRSQLEQALVNLVINACDAMPKGGKLVIKTANLDLAEPFLTADLTLAPGRYVTLVVSDTGTGIEEAIRLKIFEPFFTTKSPEHGTGLGLSMVFGIVEDAGGRIVVDSRVNEGTTFTTYLPAKAS
jgi:two-component system cell cycle sensor histidine kinase/response regulator CckA